MVGEAPARTAVVGNPSDGFGGAVIAAALDNFWATVELVPIDGGSDLVDGPDGLRSLVLAAREVFRRHVGEVRPARLDVRSAIPREVGLAGSSAVVIATLRATAAQACVALPVRTTPAIALAAETDLLGIPGGLQDRVAQLHGGAVLCDLAPGHAAEVGGLSVASVTRIEPGVLPRLVVAWLPDAAESSASPHRDLRRRWEAGDRAVRRSMDELGALARTVAAQLRDGDATALGAAMSRSFELRQAMLALQPPHADLVERIRATGADANYAGSGGAVVATVPADGVGAIATAVEPVGAVVEPVVVAPQLR